jgi:hypothetical protein
MDEGNSIRFTLLKERVNLLTKAVLRSKVSENLLHFLSIGASGHSALLGSPHLGSSDHLHRFGNLSGVLYTLYAAPYFTYSSHSSNRKNISPLHSL